MNTHAPTQSATESARQVLTLLSDYAVRNELEQFFKREWEIATGAAEAREAFEATVLKCEEEREELGEKYDRLASTCESLIEAVEDGDSKMVIAWAKDLKGML